MSHTKWSHFESYQSSKGSVVKDGSDWVGKVLLPSGKMGRLKELFTSAPVAMAVVERTWEREMENGKIGRVKR